MIGLAWVVVIAVALLGFALPAGGALTLALVQGALADIIGVGCARRLGRSCSVFRGPPPTLTEQLVSSTRVSSTGATRGPGRRQVSSGLSPRV
jgi:hypothetical protein